MPDRTLRAFKYLDSARWTHAAAHNLHFERPILRNKNCKGIRVPRWLIGLRRPHGARLSVTHHAVSVFVLGGGGEGH